MCHINSTMFCNRKNTILMVPHNLLKLCVDQELIDPQFPKSYTDLTNKNPQQSDNLQRSKQSENLKQSKQSDNLQQYESMNDKDVVKITIRDYYKNLNTYMVKKGDSVISLQKQIQSKINVFSDHISLYMIRNGREVYLDDTDVFLEDSFLNQITNDDINRVFDYKFVTDK